MFDIQICRLRSELDIVRGNTKVMSEMLTEMVPGQEDASDYELLQARNSVCVCGLFCYFFTVVYSSVTPLCASTLVLGAEQDL